MEVQIVPVATGHRQVLVDGQAVGRIDCIDPGCRWWSYSHQLRSGVRWLPDGVPADIDGPHTPADAALLLLALEGYDRPAAIEALYGLTA